MTQYINKAAVVAEIKRISCENPMDNSWYVDTEELLNFINTLEVKLEVQEEPVSEDLFEASAEYAATGEILANGKEMIDFQKQKTFIAGAEWQKAKDESTTEDLGDYINKLSKQFPEVSFAKLSRITVRVAKWQKQQDQSTIELAEDHAMLAGMNKMEEQMMKNLWKPADGNDLPEIDREVIAILDNGKVVFAHRPPEYWDGEDIVTGKVTRYYPKTYDKGGWNIPDAKYWLDVKFPKEIKL